MQVVVSVGGHPFDGVSLHCQHPAVCQRILQPLGGLEAAMAQLPVEAERDAQAACMIHSPDVTHVISTHGMLYSAKALKMGAVL